MLNRVGREGIGVALRQPFYVLVQCPNRVPGRWHLCAEELEGGVLQDASVPFVKIV